MLLLFMVSLTVQSNLTVSFEKSAGCQSKSSLENGQYCEFEFNIYFGESEANMTIEIYTSDLTSAIAVLCKPKITIGSNLVASEPILTTSTILGNSYVRLKAFIKILNKNNIAKTQLYFQV